MLSLDGLNTRAVDKIKEINEEAVSTDVLQIHDDSSVSLKDIAKKMTEYVTSTQIRSWIMVQFQTKKHTLHFVGQIMSIEKNNKELIYVFKFLEKKTYSQVYLFG